jgi:hypothetical protein
MSRQALGPTQPHVVCTRDSFPGVKASGEWSWLLSSIYVVPRLRNSHYPCLPSWRIQGQHYLYATLKIKWEIIMFFNVDHLFHPNIISHRNLSTLMQLSHIDICGLLGYYAVSCGNCSPTFRDNVSVPSSRVNGQDVMNASVCSGIMLKRNGTAVVPSRLAYLYDVRDLMLRIGTGSGLLWVR